jgi:hypothetical protein
VIEHLRRQRLRLARAENFRFGGIEPARRLHQRIEAAPARPWAFVAVGAERHVDDPGPHARDIVRAEAERGDGAWTVALHKDVRIAQQRGQNFAAAGLAQIDRRRQFPPPGVDDERLHRRQVRCCDQQHIGAVRSERATAYRPGDDAGQVEDFHPGKRALGRGQRLSRGVADLIDAEEGQASDRAALRVGVPFGE